MHVGRVAPRRGGRSFLVTKLREGARQCSVEMVAPATIDRYSPRVPKPDGPQSVEALRSAVQCFVRGFGLLASDRTPCGMPLGSSHAHALLVLAGGERDGRHLRQQDLGAALCIDKSNVARLCSKLQRLGHATQKPSPGDARSRLVSLTPRGARLAQQLEAASYARFSALLAAVPEAHRGTLLTSLAVLNDAVSRLSVT